MREHRGGGLRVLGAALAGVACGAFAAALYFLYYELTSPSPYNILLLGHAPVFMTFGGMAGLLVWAARETGRPEGALRGAARERAGESLPRERRRRSFWRGPAVGASCGALGALLLWLYLEWGGGPGPYGRFVALTYGTVFVVFCAVAGLVFGTTRDTD